MRLSRTDEILRKWNKLGFWGYNEWGARPSDYTVKAERGAIKQFRTDYR